MGSAPLSRHPRAPEAWVVPFLCGCPVAVVNKLDLCLRSTVYLPPKFSLSQVKKCKGEQREHVLRPAFVSVSRLGISNVSYLMSPL